MVERIDDMPAGTIGFRAKDEVTREDYRDVLEPALREAVESGEVRMLYVIEADSEMDAGALWEDAKTNLNLGVADRSVWKRTAIVTDADWIRRSIRMFAWMAPGQVKAFGLDGLGEARQWVAS